MEIRIPVTDDENDPLNQVVGRTPSSSLPWHFNIGRQRIRDNGTESSAFSPTGTVSLHEPMKFAHFYHGRSHRFDADPSVTDYLIESRAAVQLEQKKKRDEALAAWITLAEREGTTDFQKSYALTRAAQNAQLLEDFDKANALAAQIPVESMKQTVQMDNLLAQRDWKTIVEKFGAIDFQDWPSWQIGAGALIRGQAWLAMKEGEKAEADFQQALEFTTNPRQRLSVLKFMAKNREELLSNDEAALETYRLIADFESHSGGTDYFLGIQGAARILTRQGNYDEALAVLDKTDPENVGGSWSGSLRMSKASVLSAAGRDEEARAIYRLVADDENAHRSDREVATAVLEK